jgi:hypothetical protein
LLAYESYRFGDLQMSKSDATPRWQFAALAKRVRPPRYLNEAGLQRLLD